MYNFIKANKTYSWSTFYDQKQYNKQLINYHGNTQYIDSQAIDSFFISQCSFYNSSAPYGGAIGIQATSDDVKILIEDSIFLNCRSTENQYRGGAISFPIGKGQFVIIRSCGDSCCMLNSKGLGGQFLYSFTSLGEKNQNCIMFCSIIECGSANNNDIQQENKRTPLYANCGNQTLKHLNISRNKCYRTSTIGLMGDYSEGKSYDNIISYCIIEGNVNYDEYILYFDYARSYNVK